MNDEQTDARRVRVSPAGFRVTTHPVEPGGYVVRGELDVSAAKWFAAATSHAAGLVVVNVAELEFIDSNGMYALVALARRVRGDGGRVALQDPPDHLLRLLQIATLDEYFEYVS